jgi:hypothetical protein
MGVLQTVRHIIGLDSGPSLHNKTVSVPASAPAAGEEQEEITVQVPLGEEQRYQVHQMKVINAFDEDRETGDQAFWRTTANICCRVFPWVIALSVAYDAGHYFARADLSWDPKVWSTYLTAFIIECTLPIVVIAWSNTILTINKSQEPGKDLLRRRTLQMLGWLLLALVSGSALYMFLAPPGNFALDSDHLAVLLRVIGTMSVDPILVFCVHYTSKSLSKLIEQEKRKTQGINDLNDMQIEREEKVFLAEQRRRDNRNFLQQKEEWSQLSTDLMRNAGDAVRLVSKQAIENIQLPGAGETSAKDGRTSEKEIP